MRERPLTILASATLAAGAAIFAISPIHEARAQDPDTTPTPVPTETLLPTETLTPSVTPESTLTPKPTRTPRPKSTETVTPIPTATPTSRAEATPVPTPEIPLDYYWTDQVPVYISIPAVDIESVIQPMPETIDLVDKSMTTPITPNDGVATIATAKDGFVLVFGHENWMGEERMFGRIAKLEEGIVSLLIDQDGQFHYVRTQDLTLKNYNFVYEQEKKEKKDFFFQTTFVNKKGELLFTEEEFEEIKKKLDEPLPDLSKHTALIIKGKELDPHEPLPEDQMLRLLAEVD